jgi:hypothetical protein
MADIKRHLDNTHTHASTEQLLAGWAKRARKTGIALDDTSVLSFLRAPSVAAIVDDSAIIPSSLVDPAAVAGTCHNNFNASTIPCGESQYTLGTCVRQGANALLERQQQRKKKVDEEPSSSSSSSSSSSLE